LGAKLGAAQDQTESVDVVRQQLTQSIQESNLVEVTGIEPLTPCLQSVNHDNCRGLRR
jgi:hypothetical protein